MILNLIKPILGSQGYGMVCFEYPIGLDPFFIVMCFVKPITTLRVIMFGGGLRLFGYY